MANLIPHTMEPDRSGGSKRLRTGYLDQLNLVNGKVRKRWVIFQGNHETGIFQVKIYKNEKEKILKSSFTLAKETLVGTERGTLRKPKKKREKSAYWAVILVTDTVVFQEPEASDEQGTTGTGTSEAGGMDLWSWDTVVKSHFNNESWVVTTLKGFVAPEFQMTLHVTRHALSLVTMNPPKCRKRWELSRISHYWSRDGIFFFRVNGAASSGNETDYEMKAESESQAKCIRACMDRLLSPSANNARQPSSTLNLLEHQGPPLPSNRAPSPERYTPSPTLQKKFPNVVFGQPPQTSGRDHQF